MKLRLGFIFSFIVLLLQSCNNVDTDDKIVFSLEQRLQTPTHSVFYNLIPSGEQFLAFYRDHYQKPDLSLAYLDHNFSITNTVVKLGVGEDPRTFKHKNKWYVVDNTLNKNVIMELDQSSKPPKLTPVYGYQSNDPNFPGGKNGSFISHNDQLFMISWFYPLKVYKFSDDLKSVQLVFTGTQEKDDKFRGGTGGLSTGNKDEYFGFGHYTIEEENTLKHYPFYWTINLANFELTTKLIKDTKDAMNIFDPVTLFIRDKKIFVVTAESEKAWFSDQDYVNSVWSVSGVSIK